MIGALDMPHESSSALSNEVITLRAQVAKLEADLSEAKAEHGKTLILLNKAAFETIPKMCEALESADRELEARGYQLEGRIRTRISRALELCKDTAKVGAAQK
jgi:hypothetical protein